MDWTREAKGLINDFEVELSNGDYDAMETELWHIRDFQRQAVEILEARKNTLAASAARLVAVNVGPFEVEANLIHMDHDMTEIRKIQAALLRLEEFQEALQDNAEYPAMIAPKLKAAS